MHQRSIYSMIMKVASQVRPPARFKVVTAYTNLIIILTVLVAGLVLLTTDFPVNDKSSDRLVFTSAVVISAFLVVLSHALSRSSGGWTFVLTEMLTLMAVGAIAGNMKLWTLPVVVGTLVAWVIVEVLRSFVRRDMSALTLPFLVILVIGGLIQLDNARAGYSSLSIPTLLVLWSTIEFVWIMIDQFILIRIFRGREKPV